MAAVLVFAVIFILNKIFVPNDKGSAVPLKVDSETSMKDDSLAAIASNEARAKVSAKEVAAAKETIKRLRPTMRYQKDEFNGGWYYPKSSPKFVNLNGIYIYFNYVDDATGPNNLRFRIQYQAEDWLFIERYRFLIDGRELVYIPEDPKRDNGDGGIWEWFDDPINANSQEIVEALIKAKTVKVRFEGKDYYKDKVITPIQRADLKHTLDMYEALKVIHNN